MSNLKSVKDVVATKLAAAGGATMIESVASVLANTEIEKRKEAVIAGMAKLGNLRSELNKTRPDATTYSVDSEGKKVENQAWTKPQLAKKEELDKKVADLEKALEEAIEQNTPEAYDKLAKASK